MPNDPRAAYLRRLLEDMPTTVLESSPAFTESAGSPAEHKAALDVIELVRADRPLESGHRDIMEAIIVPFLRPVYDVVADSFSTVTDATWTPLNDHRANLERAIKAIGRVEVTGVPGLPFGGTGFFVSRNLVLTNHHVAEKFSPAIGFRDLVFHPGRSAAVDLKQEVVPAEPILLKVRGVAMVHPHWDAALLDVEGYPEDRPVLALSGQPPEGLAKRLVAVIGYPAFDTRGDASTQFKMFRHVFDRKRLLPGFTMSFREIESYGHTVEALAHDCSTLGGNSGSAVVDVATGEILGVHFAGIALESNYAVPAWELARDKRVVDLGVRFTATPAVGSAPPAWLDAWRPLEQPAPDATATAPAPGPRRRRTEGVALPPDWFERATTEDIVAALQLDREAATESLKSFLGDEEGARLARDLTPPREEGLFDFDPPPDPNLPEIVWLHGIMGGHLARPGFIRNRKWLDLKELPLGAIPKALTLKEDGVTSADGKRALEADGHLQSFYGKAERAWRKQQFVVHSYSFDWRLGVDSLADGLHRFIESLRQQRPRRFLLVAHSMGGLVCSAYAQRHPEWRDAVQRAVLMGSPLGGSYAPVMAVNGVYDLIRKLSLVPGNDLDDLRTMCSTLPGLLDMLPNPALFPDAEDAYSSIRWREFGPLQRWLDQSRNIKPTLAASPLLDRATLLVSLGHPTVSKLMLEGGKIRTAPATGAGDGTVPAKASVIAGVPAFKVTFGHSAIPKEQAAIDAVVALATTGRCDLPAVQAADLEKVFAPPEAPVFQEGVVEAMSNRLGSGDLRAADIEWLFEPGMGAPPQ